MPKSAVLLPAVLLPVVSQTAESPLLRERAPAKVNLTLHVLGRRADGYHELESLVAFAGTGDTLTFAPADGEPSLSVEGETAGAAGPAEANLVLKAVHALSVQIPGLRCGHFHLTKRLPVAAGLGGGSSDAAAALRLLARANGLAPNHPALVEAARATGADVPVCLAGRARMMTGIGDRLGPPLKLPPLFAVLVNPAVPLATAAVFGALKAGPFDPAGVTAGGAIVDAVLSPGEVDGLVARGRNDLEAPAVGLAPAVGEALDLLRREGARLARMSGSGATVFGLYGDCRAAARAGRRIKASRPGWWVKATLLR